ncbi:Hypothetical protein POVN_LOCUS521 [uncultured virus]|nr:Hypothetical protein POVN_LOCUS521 [uncultured virus]
MSETVTTVTTKTSTLPLAHAELGGKIALGAGALLLGAFAYSTSKDWYESLNKPSWLLSPGWSSFFWVVFFIIFVWVWYRSSLIAPGTYVDTTLGWTLILLIAWMVAFFIVRSVAWARWFLLIAAILMLIHTVRVWKYDTGQGVFSLLATLWLAYSTVAMFNITDDSVPSDIGTTV